MLVPALEVMGTVTAVVIVVALLGELFNLIMKAL